MVGTIVRERSADNNWDGSMGYLRCEIQSNLLEGLNVTAIRWSQVTPCSRVLGVVERL